MPPDTGAMTAACRLRGWFSVNWFKAGFAFGSELWGEG